jgi:hypothetical protein
LLPGIFVQALNTTACFLFFINTYLAINLTCHVLFVQGNPNALNPDGTASPVSSDPFGPPMAPGLPFNPMMSQPGFPPMPVDSFGGSPMMGGGAVPGYGMVPGAPAYGVPSYGMPSTPSYGMPPYGAPNTPGYGMPPYGAPNTPGYGMPNYGAPSMYNYGMPQLAS